MTEMQPVAAAIAATASAVPKVVETAADAVDLVMPIQGTVQATTGVLWTDVPEMGATEQAVVSAIVGADSDAAMAMVAFGYIFWTVSDLAMIVPGLITGFACVAAPVLFGFTDPRRIRGRTIAAACGPLTILVILAVQGASVPLVTAAHAAFAATLGYVLPSLLYRRTPRTPNIAVGGGLGALAGALMLGSWLAVGEQAGQPATIAAAVEIFRASLVAGLIGGTRWSTRLSEGWWLVVLIALTALAVAGAALFQSGAIL